MTTRERDVVNTAAAMAEDLRRIASEVELAFAPGTEKAARWAIRLRAVSYEIETWTDPRLAGFCDDLGT